MMFIIGTIFGVVSVFGVFFMVNSFTGITSSRKEMILILQEKISVLEERLKLAAETTASKNTIIHDKNRRINELEVELARMRKS